MRFTLLCGKTYLCELRAQAILGLQGTDDHRDQHAKSFGTVLGVTVAAIGIEILEVMGTRSEFRLHSLSVLFVAGHEQGCVR